MEKTCEKLPSLTVPQVPALANYGQLSLDLSIDKVQLNQQVHRYGYVWWDHLQGKFPIESTHKGRISSSKILETIKFYWNYHLFFQTTYQSVIHC